MYREKNQGFCAKRKSVGTCAKCRFRFIRTCAKSYSGIGSLLTLLSNASLSGHWRSWSDWAGAQADLGLRCPHMPEDTFSHGAAHIPLEKSCTQIMLFFMIIIVLLICCCLCCCCCYCCMFFFMFLWAPTTHIYAKNKENNIFAENILPRAIAYKVYISHVTTDVLKLRTPKFSRVIPFKIQLSAVNGHPFSMFDKMAYTNSAASDWHYENMPIQIYWKFYQEEMKIFR